MIDDYDADAKREEGRLDRLQVANNTGVLLTSYLINARISGGENSLRVINPEDPPPPVPNKYSLGFNDSLSTRSFMLLVQIRRGGAIP